MEQNYHRTVTDEQRRDFLKALGITGAVGVGSLTLGDARKRMTVNAGQELSEYLADIGAGVRSKLSGSDQLNAEFISSQQMAMTKAGTAMPEIAEKSQPVVGNAAPEEAFKPVFDAGWPLYEHFLDMGFFESTSAFLPRYTPEFLQSVIPKFVESESLALPLEDLGLTGTAGADMIATVAGNAEELSTHHWIATDEINHEVFEGSEYIPTTTQGVAGGALLWLESIDHHLWTHAALLTDEIHQAAIWHGQALTGGLQLMTEAALEAGGEKTRGDPISDDDLGALITMAFAVQAITSGLLPSDVYWITEEMRVPGAQSGVELSGVAETGGPE